MADPPEIKHFTYAGVQAHKTRNEKPCTLCLRAAAAYMKAYRNHDRCAPGIGWPLRTLAEVKRWGR